MKDEDKTKDELMSELVELRQRITDLTASETERRESEELLYTEKEKYRILVEESPLGVSIIGRDGHYKYINPKFIEIFGYTLEDIPRGREWFRKAYPDQEYRSQVVSTWINDLKESKRGESRPRIFIVTCKDGLEKTIHFRPVTMETWEQFVIYENITERENAEQEIKRARDDCLSITNLTGDIIVKVDREGRWTFLNDGACQFWGKPRKELIGSAFADYLHPDDQEKTRTVVEEVKTKKLVRGLVNRQKTPKGWRTVEWNGAAIFDEEDKYVGFQATGRDITERKKTEEELKEARSHFETLFNVVVDPVVIVDKKGKLLEVTNRVQEVTGLKREKLLGKNFLKMNLLTAKSKAIVIKNLAKRIMGMKIAPYEVEMLTKDGKKISFEINAAKIDYRGKPADMVVFRDISEREKTQEELQGALKKLRRALGATIQAMALTVETRDAYTAGHQQRVTDLGRAIAKEMKLSKGQINGIRMAGTIHDIGKIGVPAEILNKPSRLADIEFNLIKIHPLVGYNILKQIEFPWPVAEIVLQHHERMNGSGYPHGLSGEDILLEARILGVADVVEAMASHRPYRPALGIDKALEEISKNRGTLYDPQVVDACLKLFREKGFKFKTK